VFELSCACACVGVCAAGAHECVGIQKGHALVLCCAIGCSLAQGTGTLLAGACSAAWYKHSVGGLAPSEILPEWRACPSPEDSVAGMAQAPCGQTGQAAACAKPVDAYVGLQGGSSVLPMLHLLTVCLLTGCVCVCLCVCRPAGSSRLLAGRKAQVLWAGVHPCWPTRGAL